MSVTLQSHVVKEPEVVVFFRSGAAITMAITPVIFKIGSFPSLILLPL